MSDQHIKYVSSSVDCLRVTLQVKKIRITCCTTSKVFKNISHSLGMLYISMNHILPCPSNIYILTPKFCKWSKCECSKICSFCILWRNICLPIELSVTALHFFKFLPFTHYTIFFIQDCLHANKPAWLCVTRYYIKLKANHKTAFQKKVTKKLREQEETGLKKYPYYNILFHNN